MSGTIYSTYSYQDVYSSQNMTVRNDLSSILINKLACDSTQKKHTLNCLRQKSVNDLLKAFEHIYEVIFHVDVFKTIAVEFWKERNSELSIY